ncbi:formate hydrogenase [Cryobacterium sp. TMT1-3]|uniref:Formate hydrogenase n=1 Tax=Cryobacterium luteum TaxID=1424661 RepID=A0A1H8KU27_9MICO|nr:MULTISPECIES: NADH-quinone oxidoreductase subunit C [Cryobacterium]TFB87791.1 formate hydrogenase [Cryobacterium luteum]TFC30597.1 formate hydrogenase [Cryobacterium sp. TMT1-3]SEN96394.1 Ni,Fe-hydrogenase III large subunit [Cryobacterium luteum]
MTDERTPEDVDADNLASGDAELRHLDRAQLPQAAGALLDAGSRLALVACHEDENDFRIVYSFVGTTAVLRADLCVTVPRDDAWIPSLAERSLPAGNFERGIRDLYGVVPRNHPQPHRLVRHGHWPRGWYPMLRANAVVPEFEPDTESFPFVPVEGPGVYEIAVGPIHAGIIEPGHFRFSVVGETIVRMEARQWYLHRGVEKVFEGKTAAEGVLLAEQISGDTAVGHSLAFVMAVEQAAGIEVSEPDRLLRALLLELERLYNHVTDLGSLANDVGFGIIDAHALGLREQLLRINKTITGHRLLRGALSVGGTRVISLPDAADLVRISAAMAELVGITLGHAIVRGRFTGTARLSNAHATMIGTLGYVARASGIDTDARNEHPFVNLGEVFHVVTEEGGDVLARYTVRAREVEVSTAIAVDLLHRLQGHTGSAFRVNPAQAGTGLALVEAWRGTATHRVELAADGTLARVKVVDPSFLNWPALPDALSETIVPDFPLANKSFNLSYAGNDL